MCGAQVTLWAVGCVGARVAAPNESGLSGGSTVQVCIIDEADKLFEEGFVTQVHVTLVVEQCLY